MSKIGVNRQLENDPTGKRMKVTHRTSSATLKPAQTGGIFTNLSADGAITYSLPAGARTGDVYHFHIRTAQELRIDTEDATHQIIDVSLAPAAGEYITANAAGEHISVVYHGSGKWYAFDKAGTWTEETP